MTRTYVSSSGSDANDCTRLSPCATFQRAHDQTIAGGEVNALDSGNYSSLTINRSITIDGEGVAATMTPFATAVTVNVPGGTGRVVLRNLSMDVAGNLGTYGVDVVRAGIVIVDDVRIFGGSQAGIRVVPGQPAPVRLIVDETRIQASDGPAVAIEPSDGRTVRATIRRSRFDDNGGPGVRVKPSGGGIGRVTVRSSDLDMNLNGIVADASGGTAIVNVFRSAISDSGLGTVAGPGAPGIGVYAIGANATARIARNEIQGNKRGLRADSGGRILSAGDNDIVGNDVNGAPTGMFGRQ